MWSESSVQVPPANHWFLSPCSAFQLLRDVSPTSTSTLQNEICLLPNKTNSKKFTTTTTQDACPIDEVPEYSSVPTGVVPLLATQSHTYPDVLTSVTAATNRVYQEFLQSEEGQRFTGQVINRPGNRLEFLDYH